MEVPFLSLQIGCNSYSQPKVTAIISVSSENGLLIGQFLVCPAMSKPIRGDKVGALIWQQNCLHSIYPPIGIALIEYLHCFWQLYKIVHGINP